MSSGVQGTGRLHQTGAHMQLNPTGPPTLESDIREKGSPACLPSTTELVENCSKERQVA